MASWRSLFGAGAGIQREVAKPFKEQGVNGVQAYGGWIATTERNPKLFGSQKWLTFDDIAVNTPIVSASIRYIVALITKSAWSPKATDEESEEAKSYADFVQRAMDHLEQPWSTVVARAVGYRFYGFSLQEWTAERIGDGTIMFSSLDSRPQASIERWDVDDAGNIVGFVQRTPDGLECYLPRAKCVYLADNLLTDAPDGLGMLRHCAEPATRLKAYQVLEQQGFERDLRGIPIGWAPYGEINKVLQTGTDEQKGMAQAALEGLKKFVQMQVKGNSTGAVLDSTPWASQGAEGNEQFTAAKQWGIELLQGPAPGLKEIHEAQGRLNYEIARIFGTEGMMLGSDGSGSLALSEDRSSNLILAANSVLDDVVDALQKDFVDPLWRLNGFPDEMKPFLGAEKIDKLTLSQITMALRDLATAGYPLAPDHPAGDAVLDKMGLPRAETEGMMA